ncbi:imm11 family protein [Reinekea sp. G2M2-21]|uniref:imm11 family protein n=1 Tax=Reinekea sp. G2M2-21 TaxID=2788942 RepID=UPI0018AC6C44|nr:DUF1629 domain-containing protein [Reinekea sp. G2M2-21]
MSKYDHQYYIPFAPNTEDKLFLGVHKSKTGRRHRHFSKLNLAEGPMFYINNYKEEDVKANSRTPLPDVFIRQGFMVIPKPFMEFLRYFDIPGLQLFPAVYIDDDDVWHEDLWLVNLYEGLDCIDTKNSDIDYNPELWEEGDDYRVDKPSLSEAVLSQIPEDQRLLLKIKGVTPKHLYCHQRVVDFVREIGYTGIDFIKVADFKEGMQRQ